MIPFSICLITFDPTVELTIRLQILKATHFEHIIAYLILIWLCDAKVIRCSLRIRRALIYDAARATRSGSRSACYVIIRRPSRAEPPLIVPNPIWKPLGNLQPKIRQYLMFAPPPLMHGVLWSGFLGEGPGSHTVYIFN